MPTSMAANAPSECDKAVRWGTAVMGMRKPIDPPTPEPISTPMVIHTNPQPLIRASNSVPIMATAMPNSAREHSRARLQPRRAEALEAQNEQQRARRIYR